MSVACVGAGPRLNIIPGGLCVCSLPFAILPEYIAQEILGTYKGRP